MAGGWDLAHRHLIVHGKLLRPAKVAGTPAIISFVPSDVRNNAKHYTEPPSRIGSMWKERETQRFNCNISMPEDILPSLLPMLLAERLRYVVLDGTPLFRGQAEIRHYRFEALVATGLNVQHVFDDATPGLEDDRAYVGVRCLACTGIHLVSRTTGRLVSDKADE
jgi:hypothetical protein